MDAERLAEIRVSIEKMEAVAKILGHRERLLCISSALLAHIDELEAARARTRPVVVHARYAWDAACNGDLEVSLANRTKAMEAAQYIQSRDMDTGPLNTEADPLFCTGCDELRE